MIRARRAIEVGQVARNTVGRQRAFIACMALRASHGSVGTCKRKSGFGVVKLSASPLRGSVANGTISRKAGFYMIRIVRPIKILQMAARAIGGCVRELTSQVALVASHIHVRAGQLKFRRRVVVELCIVPAHAGMAETASRRKASCGVIRIAGIFEIFEMTAGAVGRNSGELAIKMALRACHARVRARQRKVTEIVVELGALPVGGCMTRIALGRQI